MNTHNYSPIKDNGDVEYLKQSAIGKHIDMMVNGPEVKIDLEHHSGLRAPALADFKYLEYNLIPIPFAHHHNLVQYSKYI